MAKRRKHKQPEAIQPQQAPRIKDPKKVLAGQARAAKGLKDAKGRYVTRVTETHVKKLVLANKGVDTSNIWADQHSKVNNIFKEAGITTAELKRYYEFNRESFEEMEETGTLKGTTKNSNQLDETIREYTGKKIIIDTGNGIKELSKEEVLLRVQKFEQFLATEMNAVDIIVTPYFKFDGELSFKIPDIKTLNKLCREREDMTLSEYSETHEAADTGQLLKELMAEMYGEDPEDFSDVVVFIS